MLKTVDDLESHVANLEALFERYDGASVVPLDEDRKIDYFRTSVFGHQMILTILLNFDLQFSDGNAHTFTQITEYVNSHLPNIKSSQSSSIRLQANMVNAISSEAYAALKTENEFLKRKQAQGTVNKNKKQAKTKQENRQPNTKTPRAPRGGRGDPTRTGDEPIEGLNYCHQHGWQHSHDSPECKSMASDKQKYNEAMRRTKGPNHPPGGCTKVNGQVPSDRTRQVAANMAASYFDDDFEDDNHYPSMGEDDETMLFLFQHEKDEYDASTAYSTTEATASMMDAFDITLVMGDAQLNSQMQSASHVTYTAEPVANAQQKTRGVIPSDTIDNFFDES